jgi:hypothetical protein
MKLPERPIFSKKSVLFQNVTTTLDSPEDARTTTQMTYWHEHFRALMLERGLAEPIQLAHEICKRKNSVLRIAWKRLYDTAKDAKINGLTRTGTALIRQILAVD